MAAAARTGRTLALAAADQALGAPAAGPRAPQGPGDKAGRAGEGPPGPRTAAEAPPCPCTPPDKPPVGQGGQPGPGNGQPAAAQRDSGDAAAAGEEVAEAAADQLEPAEASKRDYIRWTPEEEEVFYTTLKGVAGKKPEKCLTEIAKKLTSRGYTQVRHYYYRLLKRLNKILGEERKLDASNHLQVHQSMVKFWEVFVQNGRRGTCLVGLLKKPRQRNRLSNGVQKGVQDVIRRQQRAEERRAAKEAGAKRKAAEGAAGGTTATAAPAKRRKAQKKAPAAAAAAAAEPAVSEHIMQTAGCGSSVAAGEEGCRTSATGPTYSQTDANDGGEQRRGGGGTAEASHAAAGGGGGGAGGGGQQRQLRMSSANSFRSTSQGASAAVLGAFSGKVAVDKLTVRLLPWDAGVEAAMQAAGYNPFLEITCSSTKSLVSMLKHLSGKWARAVPPQGAQCMFVHPSHDCPITLRGMKWGGPMCDPQLKIGDIYLTLHCPTPFQLLYSWDASLLPLVAPAAAMQPPLAMLQPAHGALPAGSGSMYPPQQQHGSFMQMLAGDSLAGYPVVVQSAPAQPGCGAEPPLPPLPTGAVPVFAHPGQHAMQCTPPEDAAVGAAALSFDQALELVFPGQEPQFLAGPMPAAAAEEEEEEENLAKPKPKPRARASKSKAKHGAAVAAVAAAAAAAAAGASPPSAAEAGAPGASDQPTSSMQPAPTASAEPPPSEARRPRGLLGLLQPAPAAMPLGKAPSTTKKAGGRASRGVKKGGSKGKKGGGGAKQASGQAAAAPFNLALHSDAFAWQQQQQPSTEPSGRRQQQQQHARPPQQQQQPSAEPSGRRQQQQQQQQQHARPPQQQQQAAAGQWTANAAGPNAHSLLNFLDAPTCVGFPGCSQLYTPSKLHGLPDVPLLPDSGDFGLPKGWGSLSPPSSFGLPDAFDAVPLPPKSKDAARAAGAGGAAAAAGQPGPSGSDRAGEVQLGPTDFSQLFASMDVAQPTASGSLGAAAAATAAAPSLAPKAGAAGPGRPTAAMQSAVDALFGQAVCQPSGAGGRTQNRDPNNALPLLAERELENLTLSFGSLLGVGDTPSWLQPLGEGGTGPEQPAGQHLSDRPFAALFGK